MTVNCSYNPIADSLQDAALALNIQAGLYRTWAEILGAEGSTGVKHYNRKAVKLEADAMVLDRIANESAWSAWS